MEQRNAASTKQATDLWVRNFREYLQVSELPQLEMIDTAQLPDILKDWFFNICRTDDDDYKVSTMKCARAALNRYFKETRGLNIIEHPDFTQVCEYFKGIIKDHRAKGLGKTDSKPPMEPEDMEKLQHHFVSKTQVNPPCPRSLQQIIVFNVIYSLGRHGHENLREMKKNTFAIKKDGQGKKYIIQEVDEEDKNHKDTDLCVADTARIYEIEAKFFVYQQK